MRFRLLAALLLAVALPAVPPATAAETPARGSTEALFAPWDDIEGRLLAALGAARQSVHVQAYLLTSRNLARALQQAHERGVRVLILADAEMVRNGDSSQVPRLAAAGIPVWLETRYANAHNKVLIVDVESDHPVLITGSYNYTWSAQARNAENVLILRDNPAVTAQYFKNWQRHQRDAQPYAAEP